MQVPSIAFRALKFFAIAAILATAIAFVGTRDFSIGIDAGIHHAFAEQLIENRQWPLPASSFLANISHYPPAAHFLGAVIGSTFGSTFNGMLLLNAVALIASCLALSYLLRRTSPAETVASLFIFAVFCFVLRKHRFVVGNEIVENFFYAQFAGTAALLTCFVVLAKARWRFPTWLGASSAMTFVVGWFFPLSAIQLAIAAATIRLRPSLTFEGAKTRLSEFFWTGTLLAAVAIFHPTMTDMRAIAVNDGGISISNGTMAASLLFLSFVALPLLLIVSSKSNIADPVALMAIIVGVITPAILQFALLYFLELGSPYAVKKSGFLTGTLSLIAISTLAMELPALKRLTHALTYRPLVPFVADMTAPTFAFVVLASVYVGRTSTSAAEISRYNDELRLFLAGTLTKTLSGRTVSINSNYNWHTNYVVSFAQLHPGAEIQKVQNHLLLPGTTLISGAELAIVSLADAKDLEPSCTKWADGRMAAIEATCASGTAAKVRHLR